MCELLGVYGGVCVCVREDLVPQFQYLVNSSKQVIGYVNKSRVFATGSWLISLWCPYAECVFFFYIYIIKYRFSLWYVLRDICIEKLPLLNLLNPVLLHFYDPICPKSTKKRS